MLPYWFVFVAICIRLASGVGYIRGVIKGKAKPNPITWFIWGMTPLIAFVAQLQEHVGIQAWMTFTLGISPLVIFLLSLIKSRSTSHFTPFSITCGILGMIGILLWQATNNPLMAIIFSILADICGALPTISKAYYDPESEYTLPYVLSIVSMIVTLLTIDHWNMATYLFPAYIFAINVVIVLSIRLGMHHAHKHRRKRELSMM